MLYDDDPLADMTTDASTTLEALTPALPLSPQNAEALRQTVLKCAASITNQRADIAALQAEEKRLADRRQHLERRVESTEAYLLRLLSVAGVDRVKDHRFTVSLRSCPPAVVDFDLAALPDKFRRDRVISEPDKAAILLAWKMGENVSPYAKVTRRKKVEIR